MFEYAPWTGPRSQHALVFAKTGQLADSAVAFGSGKLSKVSMTQDFLSNVQM